MAETDLRATELALDEKELRQKGAGETEAGSRSQSLPPSKEAERCGVLSGYGPQKWYGCILPPFHSDAHQNQNGYTWFSA